MAIRHGLPGQYAKREARRRDSHFLLVVILSGALSFGALGFVLGYGSAAGLLGSWPVLAMLLLVYVVYRIADRRLIPYLEKIDKERLQRMRGGQAEALVSWLIEKLDDDWHVFNNLKLVPGSDIDHVVVGPGGVFCVSTKSHRGLFTGTADGLLHNNELSPFARQAQGQTLALRKRLEALMGHDVPWVQPVLAVPLGFVQGDACGGKVWLAHQDNLISRLAPDQGPKRLSPKQVARAVTVLTMIQAAAADVYVRPAVAPVRDNAGQPAPRRDEGN
jgi:hypothetical protein